MKDAHGLRLMLFDRTCRGTGALPGLTHAWITGGLLYKQLHRIDAYKGVASWSEGLTWLAEESERRGKPIAEVQYWGHGKWGSAFIDGERLDTEALNPFHPLFLEVERVRERMVRGEDALWWWRTCETLGGREGHAFARAWSRHLGVSVAGHTYVIGAWQSGLHRLLPTAEPHWSIEEGFAEDRSATVAKSSHPFLPNTIHCLQGTVPAGW